MTSVNKAVIVYPLLGNKSAISLPKLLLMPASYHPSLTQIMVCLS